MKLTSAQLAMLSDQILSTNGIGNIVASSFVAESAADEALLRQAWRRTCKRHELLDRAVDRALRPGPDRAVRRAAAARHGCAAATESR